MPAAKEVDHISPLRLAIAESAKARGDGVHPFTSILEGPDGAVLMTRASTRLPKGLLREWTIYNLAERCAMYAGAIYWTGLRRVVYGLSEHALKGITGNHPENPTLDLPCREAFAAGQRQVEVIGPLLEGEPAAVNAGVWG